MVGVRLEAEVHIITGAVTSAQNIVKCVNRAGFKVNDIVLEPLASSKAVLTPGREELGVLLIDLGGGTTDVLVHLEGAPYHTEVLSDRRRAGDERPLHHAEDPAGGGGEDQEGSTAAATCRWSSRTGGGARARRGRPAAAQIVRRAESREIIQPRMAEILGMVREQIERKGYLHLLGGGVVLTGGGSLLAGTAELAAEIFGLPARIGYPVQARRPGGGVLQPDVRHRGGTGAATAPRARRETSSCDTSSSESTFTSVWERMRSWFKEFF